MLARLQQPRHLHSEGGAAGNDMAAAGKLSDRARHRHRVDAVMAAEAFVFIAK